MTQISDSQWDEFISQYPDAHILQTSNWGGLKAGFGWEPAHIVSGNAGAQVLFRKLPLGLTMAYIPMGPIGGSWEGLWPEIDQVCRQKKAIFLKVEPDLIEPFSEEKREEFRDFNPFNHAIQPRRTILISLDGEEDAILARMKQKTRYNIRLAGRKDIVVEPSNDISLFHSMSVETGERDQFGVHTLAYYQRAYDLFAPQGDCELFIASYENEPLAGIMVFKRGDRAWYFYGASSHRERNRMPTYLLQWEGIRWAKSKGCKLYDLWGIPDEEYESLETQFKDRADGLWGVYRFKRGFGGDITRTVGAWDKVFRPNLYKLYLLAMRLRP